MGNEIFITAKSAKYFHSDNLDQYLSKGYFRMKTKMFTTNFLSHKNVYWIRINVSKFEFSKRQKSLINRISNRYFIQFKEVFCITEEEENVYAKYKRYKAIIDFDISDTAVDSLFDNYAYLDVFDSKIVTIRDNDKLIAFGVFDEGLNSIAGIMNIYDPEYKKCSLGKALILKKFEYCLKMQKKYFYPGYITKFDDEFHYKTSLCSKCLIEVLDVNNNEWIPFSVWESKFLK